MEQDHKPFQFGTNPMQMSEFERKKVILEKMERQIAHDKFTLGIQGRDGGYCVKAHLPEQLS